MTKDDYAKLLIENKVLKEENENLAFALYDLLGGQSAWYDIREQTGLPEERCHEISKLFSVILANRIDRMMGL